ncbi:putative glucosylceramidase 4 [Watersipora subatra]|uniref:putative glucosylceramidase 4 n=1 Tax=Watersipora subatra TaxID=2589382 RepID=UPI00355B0233
MAGQRCVLLLLCVTLTAVITVSGKDCDQVSFNGSSIVCRCNATYCDTVPELKLSANSYTIYTSTMAGDRFADRIVPFSSETSPATGQARVNRANSYQSIIGFGGAMTDSAGVNIMSLSENASDNLLRSYYSSQGLEYTLTRVPVACTDFSVRNYTYDDVDDDVELKHFALASEDLTMKIPLIKQAQKMSNRTINLFSTPFGAPYWMKRSGSMTHGGFLKGDPGGTYYKAYANYYVKFLEAYKDNGIEFWGLTPQNEPIFGLLGVVGSLSTGFTASQQRDTIAMDLGPALEAAGFGHLKLMIYDENTFYPEKWASKVYGDSVAKDYVSGLALHDYLNYLSGYEVITKTHEVAPDKFILSTESCIRPPKGTLPVELGSWERGEDYFNDIVKVMQNWVTGWTDWNIALDMSGGPSWANSAVDSPIIVNSDSDEFYKQPMYYAMGHFSKWVVPDSIRQEMTLEGTEIDGVAFTTPDDNSVIILYNAMDIEEVIKVTDGEKSFSVTVKARSFNTLIYQN